MSAPNLLFDEGVRSMLPPREVEEVDKRKKTQTRSECSSALASPM